MRLGYLKYPGLDHCWRSLLHLFLYVVIWFCRKNEITNDSELSWFRELVILWVKEIEGDQHISRSDLIWLFERYVTLNSLVNQSNDINKLHRFMLYLNHVLWVETQSKSLIKYLKMNVLLLSPTEIKQTKSWSNCILCCSWDRPRACSGQSLDLS